MGRASLRAVLGSTDELGLLGENEQLEVMRRGCVAHNEPHLQRHMSLRMVAPLTRLTNGGTAM